jgi:RNA polymerase sigma-70 factor (ECF subfamily)
MAPDDPSSIQTRPSLLNRLKQGDDSDSWRAFYQIYGKLVRDFAIQAGLGDTEADEVVQETAIAMARHLPQYRYNPAVCRFKTWLLNQASWRIKDQIKRRNREAGRSAAAGGSDETGSTATIHRVPDPASVDLDALFETEWRRNLMDAATQSVREKFTPKQFQIFDLLVVKEWPAAEVAKNLGVTLANVYVTRHRVSAAVKKEVKRLEKQLEQAAARREAHVQSPAKPSEQV